MISVIKAFAVSCSNSFCINDETMAIPLILVLMRSAISFKNSDPDLEGMMVVVTGVGPVAMEITMEPSLSPPSEIETKYPLENFKICKEKVRLSKTMVFCENPLGESNKL